MGNDIVVKFKFPDKICFPICLISYLPIALRVETSLLFLHTFPPPECAIEKRLSSLD